MTHCTQHVSECRPTSPPPRSTHVTRDGARDGTVYGRSLTAAKGFTSHWLRLISASIAGSVGTSISVWAHDMARGLLDDGVPAGVNSVAA